MPASCSLCLCSFSGFCEGLQGDQAPTGTKAKGLEALCLQSHNDHMYAAARWCKCERAESERESMN